MIKKRDHRDRRKDDIVGRVRVTSDEERVLRGG